MNPGDLKNKVMSWYVLDIALKLHICEFGKPRPDGFLESSLQAKKTMTPGDLENKVETPKSW